MSSCKLTLMGMYQWNNELFKNLTLPEDLDTSILIDNILVRSGEFEVMYADFEFNQYMIGAWSRKWADTFKRWVDALAIEYAPLENYDRNEFWHDSTDDTTTGNASGNTSGKTHNVGTNKVSAYDAADFSNKDQNINDGTDQGTSSSNSKSVLDGDFEHRGRIHGNIGVTTSQQMLTQELEMGYWNIYEKITDLFLTEFTIPVY